MCLEPIFFTATITKWLLSSLIVQFSFYHFQSDLDQRDFLLLEKMPEVRLSPSSPGSTWTSSPARSPPSPSTGPSQTSRAGSGTRSWSTCPRSSKTNPAWGKWSPSRRTGALPGQNQSRAMTRMSEDTKELELELEAEASEAIPGNNILIIDNWVMK